MMDKMDKIDWDKAPEGTTHYSEGNKQSFSGWLDVRKGDYRFCELGNEILGLTGEGSLSNLGEFKLIPKPEDLPVMGCHPKDKPNILMDTISSWYTPTTFEEEELWKLRSIIEEVGGNPKSIMLGLDKMTAIEFIDICISNGITFKKKDKV